MPRLGSSRAAAAVKVEFIILLSDPDLVHRVPSNFALRCDAQEEVMAVAKTPNSPEHGGSGQLCISPPTPLAKQRRRRGRKMEMEEEDEERVEMRW